MAPKYQTDILICVNNSSAQYNETFTTGQINAARQLLDSYVVALKSRACLDAVINKANLNYSRSQLKKMISAQSINQTEWFSVVITSHDPAEAQLIANTIAEVFPGILTKTINGSSVEVVDRSKLQSNIILQSKSIV